MSAGGSVVQAQQAAESSDQNRLLLRRQKGAVGGCQDHLLHVVYLHAHRRNRVEIFACQGNVGDGRIVRIDGRPQVAPVHLPQGGARVRGTARHVAATSRIPEPPADVVMDLALVKQLAERFEAYLDGVREGRDVAEKAGDTDTVDLLTSIVEELEKDDWFLRSTLVQ